MAATKIITWAAFVLTLTVALVWLRLDSYPNPFNIDEFIPIKVSASMAARGALDPNWKYISEPEMFSYPQYNFYSYNVLSHLVLNGQSDTQALFTLRRMNIMLQVGALLFVWAGLRNLFQPLIVRGAALLFLAIAPGLVHSAHMARPESLIMLLTCVVFYGATVKNRRIGCLISGIALAVGISTKVTFALTGIILLPAMLSELRRGIYWTAPLVAFSTLTTLLITSPYIFLNLSDFTSGMKSLHIQYSNTDAEPSPHATPAGVLGMFQTMAAYFGMLYGPLIILGLSSSIALYLRAPATIIGLWLLSSLSFAYFSTQGIFFERNLEPFVVASSITAAWGVGEITNRTYLRAFLILFLAVVPAYWSLQIAVLSKNHGADRWQWLSEVGLLDASIKWRNGQQFLEETAICEGPFVTIDYGDVGSDIIRSRLLDAGYTVIERYSSPFTDLPPSTLQTYLDWDLIAFSCPN